MAIVRTVGIGDLQPTVEEKLSRYECTRGETEVWEQSRTRFYIHLNYTTPIRIQWLAFCRDMNQRFNGNLWPFNAAGNLYDPSIVVITLEEHRVVRIESD